MSSTEGFADKRNAPLLSVSGLTKRFADEQAIDGAAFFVLPGEILGIIGPNGAGKTTLMETVVGLLAADAGEVVWRGEPFDGFDLRQTRDIIGVLRHHAERGRTFVLAIHQLADAERVCDRFVLLAGGRVRGSGSSRPIATMSMLRMVSRMTVKASCPT